MAIDVRPILKDRAESDAIDLLLSVDVSAFGGEPDPEQLEAELPVAEFERIVLAWDDDEPVGCTGVYSLEMSVPGGSVRAAGVTWVGVVPTHRRQGVMSALMNDRHQAIYEAGEEPIAGLWASQAPLYQRYGYGVATQHLSVKVERRNSSTSRAPSDPSLKLRMLEPADDAEVTQQVYDTLRQRRPGMNAIDSRWHKFCVQDPKADREGASKLRTVVVEQAGKPLAYARYSLKHDWSNGYADGTVNVRHLVATTPAAEAELWRHLFGLDLFERVSVWNLAIDDPLPTWLDEPRHVDAQRADALYIKLIRVGEALEQRTYTTDVDVIFEVRDEQSPWNAGCWQLTGGVDGAQCQRSTRTPDISLDASTLGAIYLGGTTLNDLAAAGWVEEHSQGAVARSSMALTHFPTAWSPFVF